MKTLFLLGDVTITLLFQQIRKKKITGVSGSVWKTGTKIKGNK